MSPIAVAFLVLSIVLVWGGLAVSVVLLVKSSDEPDDPSVLTTSDADLHAQP